MGREGSKITYLPTEETKPRGYLSRVHPSLADSSFRAGIMLAENISLGEGWEVNAIKLC